MSERADAKTIDVSIPEESERSAFDLVIDIIRNTDLKWAAATMMFESELANVTSDKLLQCIAGMDSDSCTYVARRRQTR